jgi:hypothetical protein
MKDSDLYKSLSQELAKISLVDAHNHLPKEETWLAAKDDFTTLLGYASTDLVNAGMPLDALPQAVDPRMKASYGYEVKNTKSSAEKWEIIKQYWPYVRNIGSADVTRVTLKMLFDCDDFDDANIAKIEDEMKTYKKPGAYNKLIREKSNIHTVCNVAMTMEEAPATEILAPQLYTDTYAAIQKRKDIYLLEQQSGEDIYSLETYVKALDIVIDQAVKEGLVGFKWHIFPYLRRPDFEIDDPFAAAKCLDRIFKLPARGGAGSDVAVGVGEMLPFHNYIQNHIVQRAIELDIPVQIHTGTLGLCYGGPINNGDPSILMDLFIRYPQARFNVLHTGFPYTRVMGAIAHIFPNVYINASWLDILSPQSYKQFMKDWLTGIPWNKIIAYGADQFSVFLLPACAQRVRNLLAEALAELVAEGYMTEEDAVFAADCVLRKNAMDHWQLNKRNIPK